MEKYLDRCISSLLAPNIDDIEILVINDGSTDKTSDIAHSYESKYPQSIKVIDKENGHYGSCINRGLKEATGKYVKILDADDYFETKNFESFIEKIKTIDVDLILNDYLIENGRKDTQITFKYPKNQNLSLHLINDNPSHISMHATTYKRGLLKNINYSQTEGIAYTDWEWIFKPIGYINSIFYFNNIIYKYIIGRDEQSVSASSYIKNIDNILKITESLLCFYNNISEKIAWENKKNLHWKLKYFLKLTYKNMLIEFYPKISSETINKFDTLISLYNPIVYNELSLEKSKFNYHFINYWRRNKKSFPLFINIIKILKISRKFI